MPSGGGIHSIKDLRLSQEAVTEAKAAPPLGAQAAALYAAFLHEGGEAAIFPLCCLCGRKCPKWRERAGINRALGRCIKRGRRESV